MEKKKSKYRRENFSCECIRVFIFILLQLSYCLPLMYTFPKHFPYQKNSYPYFRTGNYNFKRKKGFLIYRNFVLKKIYIKLLLINILQAMIKWSRALLLFIIMFATEQLPEQPDIHVPLLSWALGRQNDLQSSPKLLTI